MLQLDIQKEIESLKKQISDLEKKVNDKKSNTMFGRSYSQIGSSDSDFLIKTKGQVKIQWGNKFINLIKDGKINVDSKFIFTVNSVDDIGVKNGIYVTKDGSVYLKIGDSVINLVGEIGTSYVSFMEPQQTTSDQKLTALKNIGFLYDNISNVDSSAIQNGVIYVLSEQKLYTVKDGVLSEFSIEFPNPFTEQFIIQKNDSSKGALVIKGSGINNSLAFESLYIYSDEGDSYFQSEGNISFAIDQETILEITKDKSTFKVNVVSNMFQSIGADSESGFRLYTDSNGSTLEVDNLIVRNQSSDVNTVIFPNYWSLENNIITNAEQVQDESLGSGYALSLKYENQYKLGDKLYIYGEVKVDDFREKLVKIPVEVGMIDTETANIIYVQVITGISSDVDSLTELPNLIGQVTFLASTDEEIVQLRYQKQNIDLLQYTQFEDEQQNKSIKNRVGNLTDLELKGLDKKQEVPIEGFGSYSQIAAFLNAQYISRYKLEDNDCSSKLASTEWVQNLIPVGAIIMYNGSKPIPTGWAICDGTNGTPNLIGKFIKASNTVGEIPSDLNENNELTLQQENLPVHSHPHQEHTHNINFIGASASTSTESVSVSSTDTFDYYLSDSSTSVISSVSGEGISSESASVVESVSASYRTVNSSGGNHDHSVFITDIQLSASSVKSQEEVLSSGDYPNKPIKIEPRSYALIFIMKLDPLTT